MAVKWGILSTADINRKLLAGAAESDDVDVVAVGSRDLARAEEYAQTWGIERAYGSYDELLADPEVEAVYIPLPNTMHSEWSIKAVEAGKHVLCEKPFSRHIADVERAFDAAEATGMHLSEAFMYRHHPQTARLVGARRGRRDRRAARDPHRRSATRSTTPTTSACGTDVEGGSLMDVGCYCVSGARLLGGEPESVVGAAHIGSSGTDWVFTGLMRFPNDVVALFDCGTSLGNRDELEAIGTEGSLFLDDPWHCNVPVIELRQRRHGRADRGRGGESVPARARGPERGDPRRARAAPRAGRRARPGAGDRRAVPLGRRAGEVVTLEWREPMRRASAYADDEPAIRGGDDETRSARHAVVAAVAIADGLRRERRQRFGCRHHNRRHHRRRRAPPRERSPARSGRASTSRWRRRPPLPAPTR